MISPRDILSQGTTIPGGVEATHRDINRKREAVTQRISEPSLLEGSYGTKMIPQECRRPIASDWTRQSGDKRDTAKKIRTDTQDRVAQKAPSSSPDQFGAPSENVRTRNNQKVPQEQSGALKILSGMDTAEKPEKSNI